MPSYSGYQDLKILHVGNVASVGYYLVKALRDKGLEADLLTPMHTDIVSQPKEDWVIRSMNKTHTKFSSPLNLKQYDIIHMHYLQERLNRVISARLLLKSKNQIKIVHAHSSITAGTTRTIPRINSALVRSGTKLMFYSTPNLLDLIKRFPQRKVFLPNPVDTTQFKPLNEDVFTNRVLCWVKLDHIKGIDKILKIIKSCPNISFDIPKIGLAKEGFINQLPNNAHLINPVPHNQVPKLISKYPVILGQLKIGTLGLSELEAMSCGKKVITYWDRKYDKFYPEPCPVFSAFTVEDIRKFIFQAIDETSKQDFTYRNWVIKYHSIDIVADKLLNEYRTLIS